MTQTSTFEDLAQKKISTLFWQYALPAIVGSVVNTLYNIIDGVFIGHWVGKEALSGLGVILPIMNLTASVGMLVGVGAASRISINLGLKDTQAAEEIAGTSFLLTLLLSGIVIILLLIFLKPLLMFVGASEATYPHARDFLLIFLPGGIFLTLCFNFNSMMRASGYPFKAMVTMFVSVIANIILAPIFILVFNMGMRGAAIATTISMAIGFFFVMQHFFSDKSTVRLRKENIRWNASAVKAIVSVGLSPFFMQVAASIVVIFINFQLHRYASTAGATGDDAIAAFANANRLLMLVVMIVIGLTQGMQPIIGYNYGAKNFRRVKETLVYAIKAATGVTCAGFVLGVFFPSFFVRAFSSEIEIVNLSATALRYVMLAFIVIGFQIVVSSFFQCIGMASKAIFLSLSRQCLFLIPALLIMPAIFGLNGVWLANPVADLLSALLSLYLLNRQMRFFNVRILRQERSQHLQHS